MEFIACNPGDYTAKRTGAIRYLVIHYRKERVKWKTPRTQKQTKNWKKWKSGCLPFIPEQKKKSGNDGKSPLMMLAGIFAVIDTDTVKTLR